MNKKRIIIEIVIIVLIIILGLWISGIIPKQIAKISETNYLKKNFSKTQLEAVVVKVNSNSLLVMGIEDAYSLYSVKFTDEGNIGFKQGQKVLIYFDGNVMTSYPAQLGNVKKIEITQEESNIQIPKSILTYCYSSHDKVSITINELSNTGISLTITDTNEIPYNYAHSYRINKKVKNKNYTGIGEKIGEDTENSTSGYTGTGLEYIWEEVDKISNIQSEETEETLIYNLPNMTEDKHYTVERKKI